MSLSITLDIGLEWAPLRDAIEKLQKGMLNRIQQSGALAIGAVSAAKIKNTAAVYALVDGALVTAAVAETAIAGTVSNAAFNVYVVTIDSAGALATQMGTEGATLGAVVLPTVSEDKATVGFAIVNPTGTGDFVGGTTDLDDGTVAPNAVYIDCEGGLPQHCIAL